MSQTKPKFSYQTALHVSPTKLQKRAKTKEEASPPPPNRKTWKLTWVGGAGEEQEEVKQFALLLTIQYWTLSLECGLKKNIFFLTDCPWAKKNVNKPKQKLYLPLSASAEVFVFVSL